MGMQTLKIDSVLGGASESQYSGSKGTYNVGVAIDPDYSLASSLTSPTSGLRTAGLIMPTRYERFTGTATDEADGAPVFLLNNPKNTLIYVLLATGELNSYNSALANFVSISNANARCEGAAYYNNYIYAASNTNIFRYGPLTSSPTIVNDVWTGATLGSQPALINTLYADQGLVSYPKHAMHVHGDNKLYFCDYNTVANPGKGVIHYIATTKTTHEGDTDNGSTDNKLVLPFNFMPTDIESYGTDLVISAVQTTSTVLNNSQGRAALFLWDTTSATFYRGPIYVSDPLITALKSVNGELYVWSGNAMGGCRLSKYIGGDSMQEIAFIEDSPPPLPGAVESWGSRIAWGGTTYYPSKAAVVYSYGSKDKRLGNPLRMPIKATAGTTQPFVTSLLDYANSSFIRPHLIVGWADNTGGSPEYGIDKLSTSATYTSVWRSELFSIDTKFALEEIRIPLALAVAANMSIVPKIWLDNFSSSVTLPTISTTLYSGALKVIYKKLDLLSCIGQDNFCLELTFGGTAELPVGLPIVIKVDEYDDEPIST